MLSSMLNQNTNKDEIIKDMQDKVISLQDHEISFLNDTIANIWTTVSIGVGIIIAIAGVVGWIIRRSNQNAEEKMRLAEQILGDAQTAKEELLQYKADLEVYREETKKEFEELTKLVNSEQIEQLKEETKTLAIKQNINGVLASIEPLLDYAEESLEVLKGMLEEDTSLKIEGMVRRSMEEFHKVKRRAIENINTSAEAEQLLLRCLALESTCQEAIQALRSFISVKTTKLYEKQEGKSNEE